MIRVIAGLARDKTSPITTRTAAREVLPALTAQHQRLAQALRVERSLAGDQSQAKRRSFMKLDTPITPEMADKARANVARALWRGLETISDPEARADYLKGASLVKDLVGTQLDIRSGQRGRTQAERLKENANSLVSNRVGGQAIGPEIEPSYPSRQIASGMTPPNAPNHLTKTDIDRSEPSSRGRKVTLHDIPSSRRPGERDKMQMKGREREAPQVQSSKPRSRDDQGRSR
jgi:hypothetical protein